MILAICGHTVNYGSLFLTDSSASLLCTVAISAFIQRIALIPCLKNNKRSCISKPSYPLSTRAMLISAENNVSLCPIRMSTSGVPECSPRGYENVYLGGIRTSTSGIPECPPRGCKNVHSPPSILTLFYAQDVIARVGQDAISMQGFTVCTCLRIFKANILVACGAGACAALVQSGDWVH